MATDVQTTAQPIVRIDALRKGLDDAKKAGNQFALLRIARGEDVLFVTLAVK